MLEVLYEDNHLIAINKKSGDIVQGDKTGDVPLSDFVKAYIKKKYNKPVTIPTKIIRLLKWDSPNKLKMGKLEFTIGIIVPLTWPKTFEFKNP